MTEEEAKFDAVYIDFLGFIPIMTHFFNQKRLNDRFDYFLNPSEFCKKYATAFLNKYPREKVGMGRMFIHHASQLRTLDEKETREHFWAYSFSKDIESYLRRMEAAGLYPYIPYIVQPNFGIYINRQVTNQIKGLEHLCLRLSTEIRMFPQGVAVAHIKVYIKTPLSVKELAKLQKAFLNADIFNLSLSGSKKKLDLEANKSYSMQKVFEAIGGCIWKTLYINDVDDIDKTTAINCDNRVVFLSGISGVELSDVDVATIMSLSEEPKKKEIDAGKEQRIQGLDPCDVLAFGGRVALFWTPKSDLKKSRFFRMNYSNVIEFSLLQHFWLSVINKRLMDERRVFLSGRPTNLRGLDVLGVEGINSSFIECEEHLRGGHRELYKLVANITECKSKKEQFEMAFDEVWLASQLVDQINEMQKTVQTIVNSAAIDTFANLHSALSTEVFNSGVAIKSGIMSAVTTLVAAQATPFPNVGAIYNLRVALQTNIASFPNYLNSYQTLVASLLQDKTLIENTADQKRQVGSQVPEKNKVNDLLQSATTMLKDANDMKKDLDPSQPPKTFWEKAKPYVGLLAGATTAVLKAVGLLPL